MLRAAAPFRRRRDVMSLRRCAGGGEAGGCGHHGASEEIAECGRAVGRPGQPAPGHVSAPRLGSPETPGRGLSALPGSSRPSGCRMSADSEGMREAA